MYVIYCLLNKRFHCYCTYQASKRAARTGGPAWPDPARPEEAFLLGRVGLIREDRWAGRAKIFVGPPDPACTSFSKENFSWKKGKNLILSDALLKIDRIARLLLDYFQW